MNEQMTEKAEKFIRALRSLCRDSGVFLSVSGYDAFQVWDIDPNEDPLYSCGIEDKTSTNDHKTKREG